MKKNRKGFYKNRIKGYLEPAKYIKRIKEQQVFSYQNEAEEFLEEGLENPQQEDDLS